MKKFEEEIDKNIDSIALRQNGEPVITVCDYNKVKEFGHSWVSPEDYQAKVDELNKKIDWLHGLLDERNEEVLQTVKLLNEAQPVIPELPPFVAEDVENYRESHHPMDGILNSLEYTGNETLEWLVNPDNQVKYVEALISREYTVAKEKRFYLKNKLTGLYLYKAFGGIYAEQSARYINDDEDFNDDCKFTQQEIESMETGSYEQIEVEE